MNDSNIFGGDVFGEDSPAALAARAQEEEDNDDDNLYDDLKLQAAVPPKKTTPGDDQAAQQLKAQINQLQQENATLKRNISTLYRTAKHELNRKDKRIAALEEQLLDKGKMT